MKHGHEITIISGGQTGVDRAALDAAIDAGIPCGGYCPLNRRADDGPIPDRYPLTETRSEKYPFRTRMNVESSDGTLILISSISDLGTFLTAQLCKKLNKPLMQIDLCREHTVNQVIEWMERHTIKVLNVAGPREKSSPGIYDLVYTFCRDLFTELKTRFQPTENQQ